MKNSIVRENLINEMGYTPYCGDVNCTKGMPRTFWNAIAEQFSCSCGWISKFPSSFIKEYKNKWFNQTLIKGESRKS